MSGTVCAALPRRKGNRTDSEPAVPHLHESGLDHFLGRVVGGGAFDENVLVTVREDRHRLHRRKHEVDYLFHAHGYERGWRNGGETY